MKTKINQVIAGLATIAWGIVPVYLYTSGAIIQYLTEGFHLIALIGGLAMIVLGLFNILTVKQAVGCGHDHHHDHEHDSHDCGHDHEDGHVHGPDCAHKHDHEHDDKCEHGHDHGAEEHHHHDQSPVAAICLMILPVILCTSFTKHEYSLQTLSWRGAYDLSKKKRKPSSLFARKAREPFTRERLLETTPKSPDGNYILKISELYWSAGDDELMKAYDGFGPVEIRGQIIDEDDRYNPEGNRKRIFEIAMNCCAADAQVLGVSMEFTGPLPDMEPKTWVKAVGSVHFETIDGQDVGYLKVTDVSRTSSPNLKEKFGRSY